MSTPVEVLMCRPGGEEESLSGDEVWEFWWSTEVVGATQRLIQAYVQAFLNPYVTWGGALNF